MPTSEVLSSSTHGAGSLFYFSPLSAHPHHNPLPAAGHESWGGPPGADSDAGCDIAAGGRKLCSPLCLPRSVPSGFYPKSSASTRYNANKNAGFLLLLGFFSIIGFSMIYTAF